MVTVNSLEEARAALERGDTVLESAPFAACYAGVNYFQAMLKQLTTEFDLAFTLTLCCGDDAAIAHDALRLGLKSIRCECDTHAWDELTKIATSCGATLIRSGRA